MGTIRRSTLVTGLGALLLVLAWMLTRDGFRGQPTRALEAEAPSEDASTPAPSNAPDAAAPVGRIAMSESAATNLPEDSTGVELRIVEASGAPAPGSEAWFDYSWDSDPLDAFPFPLDLPSESATAIAKTVDPRVASGGDGLVRLSGIQSGRDLVLFVGGPHWKTSSRRIAPLASGELRQLGTISLLPASRILGRVLDPEGRPLAHAVAELRARDGRATNYDAPEDQRKTFSREDGTFEFAGLAPGAYALRGSATGLGLAFLDPLLVLEGGADVTVELHLPAGIPLHGRILDENLAPLPTARVLLTDGRLSDAEILESGTPVDAEGRFELGAPADLSSFRLVAAAPAHAAGSVQLVHHEQQIELVLTPVLGVSGRVLDASGAPVAGALLRLQPFPDKPRLLTSAADGSFEYTGVAPGEYCIEASATCGSAAIPSLLVYPGLESVELRLFGGPGVQITVLGADAEPLPGALVELFPEQAWADEVEAARETSVAPASLEAEEGELPPTGAPLAGSLDTTSGEDERPVGSAIEAPFLVALPRRGITDENGTVLLLDVPTGTWQAQVSLAGFLDGTLYFERNEEFLEQMSLELQRASRLRVRVVGSGGEPVPDTDIVLRRETQFSDEEETGALLGVRTDASGMAIWRRPPPGDYTLQAQVAAPTRRAENSATTVLSSESIRVHLEPGATVEERLVLKSLCLPTVRVTRRGVPVPGAEVAVLPGDLPPEEALLSSFGAVQREGIATEASGKVLLHACLPGLHTLAAIPPGSAPATLTQVELKAGAQWIEISLAEGRITGRVEGQDGRIAGAQVTLVPALESHRAGGADSDGGPDMAETESLDAVEAWGSDTSSEAGAGCTTASDAAGEFRIEDVPPGRYRLRVRAPRFRTWLSEAFEHDGKRSMDLGTIRW